MLAHFIGSLFLPELGDFTVDGTKEEVLKFKEWLVEQPHKDKIVIEGNHDIVKLVPLAEILSPVCHFLKDSSITLHGMYLG
jgi:hypothetical protein